MKLLLLVPVLGVLVACSSSGGSQPAKSADSGSSSTAAFTTTYGQDAALLASHIPGCADVTSIPAGGGSLTGEVGSASCTMLGHKVLLYTWKDAASNAQTLTLIGSETLFSSSGVGWSEFAGDDAAGDAQQAIAQAVASALGGTVHAGSG